MDLEFLIPISVFLMVFGIVKVVSDNGVKNNIVKKGVVNADFTNLFAVTPSLNALKWALVLIGVGIAVGIGFLLPAENRVILITAMIFVFSGLGFLIYFFIAKRNEDQLKNKLLTEKKAEK